MGTIVRFPEGQRSVSGGRYVDAQSEPADVIILPVVRIDRGPDSPPSDGLEGGASTAPGRRRRRRAARP